MASDAKKIKKIKMPVAGETTELEVYDVDAVHSVGKINGAAIEGSTDFILPNTAITTSEIEAEFNK